MPERSREFEGVFVGVGGSRPVLSRPPMPKASREFVREVADALSLDGDAATSAADWIAGKLERFGMWSARPVFEMDGTGPACSNCGSIWPLCGCHYYSGAEVETEGDESNG